MESSNSAARGWVLASCPAARPRGPASRSGSGGRSPSGVYLGRRMAAEHDLAVSFSVPFRYSVHFTERVLEPDNRVLIDALCRLEPQRRHRVLAVIDDGVERAHPQLAASLR